MEYKARVLKPSFYTVIIFMGEWDKIIARYNLVLDVESKGGRIWFQNVKRNKSFIMLSNLNPNADIPVKNFDVEEIGYGSLNRIEDFAFQVFKQEFPKEYKKYKEEIQNENLFCEVEEKWQIQARIIA